MLNMIMNMLFRRVINTGITKGINHFANKGKPAGDTTPQDKAQAKQARELGKRARQASRIGKRLL